MRKTLICSAIAGALLLSILPAQATHSATANYAASGGTSPGLSLSTAILGNNIGGVTFPSNTNELPVRVDVADASLQDVPFTVCQDLNGALCGEAGEPSVIVCGTTADLSLSVVPFDPTIDVTVFVRTFATSCPGGSGSNGSITLTYGDVPA